MQLAGVLVRQEGKGHWAALKRAFRLLVDDVDDQNPTDAAYVFSGHCPLTVSSCMIPFPCPGCAGCAGCDIRREKDCFLRS